MSSTENQQMNQKIQSMSQRMGEKIQNMTQIVGEKRKLLSEKEETIKKLEGGVEDVLQEIDEEMTQWWIEKQLHKLEQYNTDFLIRYKSLESQFQEIEFQCKELEKQKEFIRKEMNKYRCLRSNIDSLKCYVQNQGHDFKICIDYDGDVDKTCKNCGYTWYDSTSPKNANRNHAKLDGVENEEFPLLKDYIQQAIQNN